VIALIDDNAAHRLLIKRAVRKVLPEMPLTEFGSYWAALSYLASCKGEPPTLFLVDLNLGDGRGTDLAREIRKRWPHKNPPVLLLSTSNLEQDRQDAIESGVSQYILKHDDPVKFSEQMTDLMRVVFGVASTC